MPLVWLSSWRRVTASLRGASRKYVPKVASRSTLPFFGELQDERGDEGLGHARDGQLVVVIEGSVGTELGVAGGAQPGLAVRQSHRDLQAGDALLVTWLSMIRWSLAVVFGVQRGTISGQRGLRRRLRDRGSRGRSGRRWGRRGAGARWRHRRWWVRRRWRRARLRDG